MQVVPIAAFVETVLLHFGIKRCGRNAKGKKSHEECFGKHDEGETKVIGYVEAMI